MIVYSNTQRNRNTIATQSMQSMQQYLNMFGGGKPKGELSDNESEDEEQAQDALLRKNTRANAAGTGAPDALSDMESNASTTDDDDDDDDTSSVANSVANTNTSEEEEDDDDADSLNFDDLANQAQQPQALTLTPAMIAKSAASALAANPEVKKKAAKRVAKGKATLEDITTLQQSYDDLELNEDDDASDTDGDDAEDADDGTNYLRKFDSEMRENYITSHHHEMMQLNAAEVDALVRVVRNADGMIVDSMHQTMPFLTKYEKTRVLGQRAKQVNQGAQPLVPVDKKIIDGYLIAQLELQQKALPFIIRRPLPGGKSEYWRLADLELI